MKKSLTLGAVFISSLVLAACGNGNTKKDSASNKTATVAKPKTEKYYFKNNELKIHDLKIKITKSKVIPVGEEGNEYGKNPVLAIWYKVTNLTDKKIDPNMAWMSTFEAYQDNNKDRENKLNVGSLPDQKFIDTQQENIKKNGTVENAVAYELDDDKTPVTLKATQGVGGKELGTETFKIKEVLANTSSSASSESAETSSTQSSSTQSSSTTSSNSTSKPKDSDMVSVGAGKYSQYNDPNSQTDTPKEEAELEKQVSQMNQSNNDDNKYGKPGEAQQDLEDSMYQKGQDTMNAYLNGMQNAGN